LDHWAVDVSPFSHVPKLPGGTMSVTGLVALAVVAIVLVGAGVFALDRRDIG
jgi:ABC-2 type transport system permease protein